MRRVVIEMSRGQLLTQDIKGFEKIESFRSIHVLRRNAKVYAGICNIRLRSSKSNLKDLIGVAGITKTTLLSKENDGSLTVYIEGRSRPGWVRPDSPGEGYQDPPFELEGDRWRMTFLGSESQVRKLLAKASRQGLQYRIVHSGNAKFGPTSPLSALTERQEKAILMAHRMGYYDFPRRIKSKELAKSLGITKATLAQHLRKAEKVILDGITSTNPRVSQL